MIPTNLEECFSELKKKLPLKEQEELKNLSENELGQYHFGLGMWLRNNWQLHHASPLHDYFKSMGIEHPDDMSAYIIQQFHHHLNDCKEERSQLAIHEQIALITSMITETTSAIWGILSPREEFKKLDLGAASKILLELVLFLLHFCDRQIFCLVGPEKRKILMDGVLENVFGFLEKYDEKVLLERFGEQTSSNLNAYFKYLSKMALSTDFRGAYNERQEEYAVYKKLFPEEGELPKDTLVWEFSKKIMQLEGGTPVGMMRMIRVSSEMIQICIKTLESIFEIK
jgi:hypothetical protein